MSEPRHCNDCVHQAVCGKLQVVLEEFAGRPTRRLGGKAMEVDATYLVPLEALEEALMGIAAGNCDDYAPRMVGWRRVEDLEAPAEKDKQEQADPPWADGDESKLAQRDAEETGEASEGAYERLLRPKSMGELQYDEVRKAALDAERRRLIEVHRKATAQSGPQKMAKVAGAVPDGAGGWREW